MKNKKWLWLTFGALAVFGGGFLFLKGNGIDKTTYRLEKIDRGDIVLTINATGTLQADTTVQVGSQVSGRIARLFADFNSVVKKGQVLAQLDPTFLQAALDQAKAGVARARASLNQADRDYKRMKDLSAKDLISQADMDASVTAFESAQANLQQAQAALQGALVNLRYATITSPISGVVISRNVDVGQTVAASLQAPTIFAIANDLSKMQVQASVDEADIGSVKMGQRVIFRVDSHPEAVFEGTVTQVRLAPVITQNVVNYTVIISVKNPESKLMPGMTATVSIELDKRENVLRAPVQAVRFTPPDIPKNETAADSTRKRPEGKGWKQGDGKNNRENVAPARVWVLADGKPKPVRVARGLMNTQYAEIVRSDLKEGDEVIIAAISSQPTTSTATQNPFQPRIPGGGGGGRRGGL